MQIEILLTILLLFVLSLLATVDMAFSHLTDVGLRRLISEPRSIPPAPPFCGKCSRIVSVSVSHSRQPFRSSSRGCGSYHFDLPHPLFQYTLRTARPGNRIGAGRCLSSIDSPLVVASRSGGDLPVSAATHQAVLSCDGVCRRSLHSWFDRGRRKEQLQEDGEDEDDEDTADDIQALIDVGEAEGILEEEEGELIHSILEFGDTSVGEVMTPRPDIVALPTASVREARDVIIASKYSRLPVYRDQIDNVEGFIYVRDLLQCWAEDQSLNRSLPWCVRFILSRRQNQSLNYWKKCRSRTCSFPWSLMSTGALRDW